jgi:urea transporter
VRKFLLIRGCLFDQRRVGDDKLRANQELIWDGLLGFNGALTLIALVAFTTKNFAQDNIPSFKLLVYLALAEEFSTILRRAYTTNVFRG